jgi:RecA-family ATPase
MSIDEAAFMAKMNVVNWEELWADTSEEIWFVDGLICAERGHTIYSDPGVGKSLLVREICACLASGKSVLGLPPKEPIRILYIDHENIPKTDIRRSLIDMGFDWPELKENFILMSISILQQDVLLE